MGLEEETKKVATKVKNTPEQKAFWELAEVTAEEVRKYPDWKKYRYTKDNRKHYVNILD